ncbi:protein indeterminate-domain 4, chloroplastic-like isoform X2 [Carex rostrata]
MLFRNQDKLEMDSSSPASFFGIRNEESSQIQNQISQQQQSQHQQPPQNSAPSSSNTAQPPVKKKRNLPDPDAEVIALSPRTLMATNRFVCEVCNKGFQREQNLQLHRRGHNLPWKLKQKNPKEVARRKVYLCPEPSCVHHDPSRALGDLTGIKKHFCRKHGEKKWKCEKCSKRYAVQSDWKAHSKICGTREYRCDCGTLFSRRDSFITHRAFCDALAQESARLPSSLSSLGSHLYGNNSSMALGLSQVNSQIAALQDQTHPSTDLLRLGGSRFEHLLPHSNPSAFRPPPPSAPFFLGNSSNQHFNEESQTDSSFLQSKPFHGLMQLPDLQGGNSTAAAAASSTQAASTLFNLGFYSNSANNASTMHNNNQEGNPGGHMLMPEQFNSSAGNADQTNLFSGNIMGDHMVGSVPSLYSNASVHNESMLPQMSATALLQKAAQMGANTSNGSSILKGFGNPSSNDAKSTNFKDSMRSQMENESHIQNLMNSLAGANAGFFSCTTGDYTEQEAAAAATVAARFTGFNPGIPNMEDMKFGNNGINVGGLRESDRLTRDFLGVGGMVRGLGSGNMSQSQREQQHANEMSSLDSEMKSGSSTSRSFAGGRMQ